MDCHRLPDRGGDEGRARVVEVGPALATRGLGAPAGQVGVMGWCCHDCGAALAALATQASSSVSPLCHCWSNAVAALSRPPSL